jgi:hypothetical protein
MSIRKPSAFLALGLLAGCGGASVVIDPNLKFPVAAPSGLYLEAVAGQQINLL